ncbi:MAG: ABC transporter permease [Phycisphaerae bacterium]|nr:ABC transporter permease [Tepidisphaeraceae bacterium]
MAPSVTGRPAGLWRQVLSNRRVLIGGGVLLAMLLLCVVTIPWTMGQVERDGKVIAERLYLQQDPDLARKPPQGGPAGWMGYDDLGRSVMARALMGGTISLAVGFAAATIAVLLGVSVGVLAGYKGGWVDALLMRSVDVLYGLPYVLLVVLFKVAFEPKLVATEMMDAQTASVVVLFLAIGLVSWLTMARVVRGQVLSLRGQPFIEACRAMGMKEGRIFVRHILPNLVGPITVYATLTVPSAMLQESFLSFLGVGINPPLPSWGNLASEAVELLYPKFYWWMLVFPCTLLAVTLLALNFVGDGLRDVFDPKKEAAKI